MGLDLEKSFVSGQFLTSKAARRQDQSACRVCFDFVEDRLHRKSVTQQAAPLNAEAARSSSAESSQPSAQISLQPCSLSGVC
jgi:hypothetical protein